MIRHLPACMPASAVKADRSWSFILFSFGGLSAEVVRHFAELFEGRFEVFDDFLRRDQR